MPESVSDLYSQEGSRRKPGDDVGFFESALAGVATGLWNVPKKVFSFGAEIFDLIGDTNTAKEIEDWFDDVNPWDDEAEARTIGKVTQAITQVAPMAVGGAIGGVLVADRIRKMSQAAIAAKKSGNVMKLARIGEKIMGADKLTKRGKLVGGIVGGGVGEALVADQDIGTFADMARGTSLEPLAITMMDRDESLEGRADAYRRLKNRLKFGTEGALFSLALVGAGSGLKKLRTPSTYGVQEYAETKLGRALQRFGITGLKPEGMGTKQILESRQYGIGNIRSVEFQAGRAVQEFDKAKGELGDVLKRMYALDDTGTSVKKLNDELIDIISPAIETTTKRGKEKLFTKSLLKSQSKARGIEQIDDVIKFRQITDEVRELSAKQFDLAELNRTNKIPLAEFMEKSGKIRQKLYELNKDFTKLTERVPNVAKLSKEIDRKGLFKIEDYRTSPEFKNLLERIRKNGGDPNQLKTAVFNMRRSIDNMSARLLQRTMPEDIAKNIKGQLGSYTTTMYEQFEKQMPLLKYEPTAEQITRAKELLRANKVKEALDPKQALDPEAFARAGGADRKLTPAEIAQINKEVDDEINYFLRKKTVDEVDVEKLKNQAGDVINNPNKEQINNVTVQDKILTQKILKPWQRELAGVIKDPSYTFLNTVSKQAHLNYTLKYMDDVLRFGSEDGPGKFIFKADELSPLDAGNPLKFKKIESSGQINGLSKLEGMYMRAPIHDAVFDTTSNWLNRSGVGTFYKYGVLAPKAISQIAKTILSPLTHARNFISASAFVAANGAAFPNYGDISMLMPKSLGGEGVLGQAYGLTGRRVLGTMTKADDALYERLLRVGVVDSSVQIGEFKRIIKDVINNPGQAEAKAYTELLNNNKSVKTFKGLPDQAKRGAARVFGKLQDAYVAEDDFFKYVNFSLERNRYSQVLKELGVNQDNFKQALNSNTTAGRFLNKLAQRKEYIEGAVNNQQGFSNLLDELAGSLTRNNVPNYGYVGRTARALRQSPFGNFIAFPLEIMRTGNNIYSTAIDEITSGIGKGTYSNPEIPGLMKLGLKRLFSFGMTVGGVPYTLVQTAKAVHNVTDEEMEALRRMVPEWSKNSTLIPVGRDENGYLKYTDFSYNNAYDTLIRPFQAVVNALNTSGGNKDSLMEALGTGMTDALSEVMKPYATESIYTEALIDSTIRRGIGREGRRVWDEADDIGVRMLKGTLHVAKSLQPGSIAQFKRIGDAVRGKADKKYGQTFNLSDELPGLIGLRAIDSNPERAMKYMVTSFGSNLKKADNLFIAPLLRGGRVSPEQIVDQYKYSEQRRFAFMRDMYKDIEAARALGMPDNLIRRELEKRKGLQKDVIRQIMSGTYVPKPPSSFFVNRIREINNKLNEEEGVDVENPYFIASPFIGDIISDNRNIDLLDDELMFRDIDVPSPPGIMDSIAQSFNTPTTQGGSPNINIVGGGGGSGGASIPYDKMTVAQKIEYDKAMRGI
jgi:hypothetical protein